MRTGGAFSFVRSAQSGAGIDAYTVKWLAGCKGNGDNRAVFPREMGGGDSRSSNRNANSAINYCRRRVAGLNSDEKLISWATTMKTQSIRTATTTLLLLSNHTTRRIVSAAAFFSSSSLLLARAFSSSSSSSSVFARSLRITHHTCHHHHRWSFLSTRGGSSSVASPTLSSYLSSSVSSSLSSTIISSTTPMDQVRASASAKTAAEKLIAMRGKMEEYGVDGESSFISLFTSHLPTLSFLCE